MASQEEPSGNPTSSDNLTRPRKRRTTPVVLRAPQTVPINDDEYQQAVTALAAMIASWWHDQHTDQAD